jgi:hypothetical protein
MDGMADTVMMTTGNDGGVGVFSVSIIPYFKESADA